MTTALYPDILPVLNHVALAAFDRFFEHPLDRDSRHRILHRGDDAACRYGPLTREIARSYGQPLAVTRRQLSRAARKGHVVVERCAGGMSRWWPAGLAAQLRDAP
ncbi:MAG: hypothetical protein ACREPQ_00870 [Rhodanobacter sp.]